MAGRGREAPVDQKARAPRCWLCASSKGWRVPVERDQRPGQTSRRSVPRRSGLGRNASVLDVHQAPLSALVDVDGAVAQVVLG